MESRVGSFGRLAPVGVETTLVESGRQGQSQRKSAARWISRRKTDEYYPTRRQDTERAGWATGCRCALVEPAVDAASKTGCGLVLGARRVRFFAGTAGSLDQLCRRLGAL